LELLEGKPFVNSITAVVDIGGSGVKVTIFDFEGTISIEENIATPHEIERLSVTSEPQELFKTVIHAMNSAARKLHSNVKICKLYVSSIRQGFCIIGNSKETTPIFYNSDRSGIYAENDIEQYGHQRIYEETGHWFAPQLTLPKLIHLKRNQPELFSKQAKLAFVHDWLIWRLTNLLFTEMTLVSAGQLALISARTVHEQLLDDFKIEAGFIPQRRTVGEEVSGISRSVLRMLEENWAQCSVFIGGGDSHFLHAGASNNQRSVVVISAGSSTPITVLKTLESRSGANQPWVSTSFAIESYLYEGNVGYPGTYFGWLKSHSETNTDMTMDSVSVAQIQNSPFVFGSCRHWNMDSWADCPPFSILNQRASISPQDLMFGLTLDYVFALQQQIEDLSRKTQTTGKRVVMTGGGSNKLLASLLATLIAGDVSFIDSADCVRNSIMTIQGLPSEHEVIGSKAIIYSEDIKSALMERDVMHKEFYEVLEKSGKWIPSEH
jgi:sugar (pentulose or hexulose) kinase